MALSVSRVDVWGANIEDKPGGLADKLAALANAGAQLELVVARRTFENPGTGLVFLAPLKGPAQIRAAKKAGFVKNTGLHCLRVEGPDKPGAAAQLTQNLAQAGINLRGLSAVAVGKRFLAHLALDDAAAALKASRILKQL
ncbi:MAG: amino acid-binding protein [Planctomycetota bacterium]|nr:amino acid-binding protein [Planctomycetota bacterium]